MGDLHFAGTQTAELVDLLARVSDQAEILALCGDLTTHGRPDEMRALARELEAMAIPVVAVLGNHDYESEEEDELMRILRERGVHVLDGDPVEIMGVGFTGTKGFAGGFGRGTLAPFGEKLIKDFVQAALAEALKLERGLRMLHTPTKVVLMHYSPIPDTLVGEPENILPFLGSSRLLEPIQTYGASVVFHGHAHVGTAEGQTPSGVPVFNVALPLLRAADRQFLVWACDAPERRAG